VDTAYILHTGLLRKLIRRDREV